MLTAYLVSNPTDSPTDPAQHSLRWAIEQVDTDGQTGDVIDFGIGSGGAATINLESSLPLITNSVLIDGTSQGGYAGTPLIEINGAAYGVSGNGLELSAASVTVQGLSIVGFSSGDAIAIDAASSSDIIQANYLGVGTSGTSAVPNQNGIVIHGSSANTIGGLTAAAGNLISGNTGAGLVIDDTGGAASGNQVLGNLIGTTANGLSALPNSQCGIAIEGATNTEIGIPAVARANVISGNLGPGVLLTSAATGTTLENNDIGVGSDGQTVIGNGGDGILVNDAPQTQIGGTNPDDGNVISSNRGNGINIENNSSGVVIQGNFIGTDETVSQDLGNVLNGINLQSSSNTIGGTAQGAANVIDFNGGGHNGSGVQLVGDVVHNQILSNSIYKNAWLGINLGDGPTTNQPPGTPGPNDYQTYPDLNPAYSDGSVTSVSGSLYSLANTSFVVQFYASQTPSSTEFGEGQVLIGSSTVTTNSSGDATFAVPLPVGVNGGEFISATATSPSGDTSEFCEDVEVQGQINLVLSGASSPNPVLAGGLLTYNLTVANEGLIASTNVFLTDQLPAGVTLKSTAVSQGFVVPNMGGSTVEAALGTISPGGSATLTIVVQTSSSFLGTLTDQASVTSQQTDPDPADESVTINTLAVTSAALTLSMSTTQNSVLAGSDLTYSISVSNTGPGAASGVQVTLPLESGVQYESSSWPTVAESDGQVVATVGAIADSGDVSFTITVAPFTAGQLTETATVTSTSINPNSANDSAAVNTTVVPAADLAIGLAGSGPEAVSGDDYQYTVTVTNNGPSTATGVQVSDTLPQGTAFVLASSYGGVSPVDNNGTVTLSIAELDSGVTASFTIEVTVGALQGSTLSDTASVSGQQADPVLTNNTSTIQTPVVGTSDLALVAAAPTGTCYVGQPLTFMLTATNAGPDNEPFAVVNCVLPSDVVFSSASSNPEGPGPGPTVNQGVLTLDLGLLPAYGSASAKIVVIPQAAAAGTLTMSFAIQGEDYDPNLLNNTAQASVTITPAADLSVALAPGTPAPCDLADWSYKLTVTDIGLSAATGVTVLAPLPSNAEFVERAVDTRIEADRRGRLRQRCRRLDECGPVGDHHDRRRADHNRVHDTCGVGQRQSIRSQRGQQFRNHHCYRRTVGQPCGDSRPSHFSPPVRIRDATVGYRREHRAGYGLRRRADAAACRRIPLRLGNGEPGDVERSRRRGRSSDWITRPGCECDASSGGHAYGTRHRDPDGQRHRDGKPARPRRRDGKRLDHGQRVTGFLAVCDEPVRGGRYGRRGRPGC